MGKVFVACFFMCIIFYCSNDSSISQNLHRSANKIDNVNNEVTISRNVVLHTQSEPAREYSLVKDGCIVLDEVCLDPADLSNYEAIKTLHAQLDDDHSGDIDVTESVDFLKEELQYAKGFEKRQEGFHHNNDNHISVKELWDTWRISDVHNWTVEETVSWLINHVDLSQYSHSFYENHINGSVLPRLATNNDQCLSKVLGISDLQHRSKITIKAMDAVLFGSPKVSTTYTKDFLITVLVIFILLMGFKFYSNSQEYKTQLNKMLNDMEVLRKAEPKFREVEEKLKQSLSELSKEHDGCDKEDSQSGAAQKDQRLQILEKELEEERERRKIVEEERARLQELDEVEDRVWSAPRTLQMWLQVTYERERLAFEKKNKEAWVQYSKAKELCDKLYKQRGSFFGVLKSVHGRLDSSDETISKTKALMDEIFVEAEEREHRWRTIESLCGCTISHNPGLQSLYLQLRPRMSAYTHSTYAPSIGRISTRSSSMEDFDDISCTGISYVEQLLSNQSALMFLTMGGYSGLPAVSATSNMSIPASVNGSSSRRRSTVLPQDSCSSVGSDSSGNHKGSQGNKNGVVSNVLPAATNPIPTIGTLHHSLTLPCGELFEEEEDNCNIATSITRSSSTGSLTVSHIKGYYLHESSNEEMDNSSGNTCDASIEEVVGKVSLPLETSALVSRPPHSADKDRNGFLISDVGSPRHRKSSARSILSKVTRSVRGKKKEKEKERDSQSMK